MFKSTENIDTKQISNIFALVAVYLLIPLTSCNADEIAEHTYEHGIKLIVKTESFQATKHEIIKCRDGVCLIDGKPFFGSDGDMPETQLASIEFKKDEKAITLDVSSMFNPAVTIDNIQRMLVVEPYWGDFYKVTGHFSGGAAAYVAQWIVSVDGSVRIHLSDFESLFDLSSKINRAP